ncbi:MAG: hypothetical protein K0S32_2681 [Bacteroidetes bacterium]|jgi:predicted short-subunit dehydrogenase-like oxidoreductase (DUF2520 family)|nr:hypothetical protein [Bacteroidota bacterium]
MPKKAGQTIVIIGCGNLAWHLATHSISLKEFKVVVHNHQPNKLLSPFETIGCEVHTSLNKITKEADFYFICVSDQFIARVSKRIKTEKGIVIHTSGSKNISELQHENCAVFYPVQTFSKNDRVDWKKTPVLIEASGPKSLKKIKTIANLFSREVTSLDSEKRLRLHLSAVLVNNFTNAMYVAADDFLSKSKDKKINFKLLKPLIRQTVTKLDRLSPLNAQTGPAKRNDKKVMKLHSELLSKDKELQKLYKQLSHLIQSQQNQHA